jgi:hypothetical protein
MVEEGIDDYDTFHVWLEEEKDYLLGLDAGLPKKREETVEMEYVQRLVNLEASEYVFGSYASSRSTNLLCLIEAEFAPYETPNVLHWQTRQISIRHPSRR